MSDKKSFHECETYQSVAYSRRQMRDTIEGPNKVKLSNILYLPMPSSFTAVPADSTPSIQGNATSRFNTDFPAQYTPWWHPNPAYRAYLQRARFPDITSNALRGFLGVATKVNAKIELPSQMKYLEEGCTKEGKSLQDFFAMVLTEILSIGNHDVIVNVDSKNNFYLASYCSENQIDWETETIDSKEIIKEVVFSEEEGEIEVVRKYYLDENNIPAFRKIVDGEEEPEVILSYIGKSFDQIPIFPCGANENTLEPNTSPLIGISDIAIGIYQENADLRQSHYMTCNPTLFCFGLGEDETPKIIGSTVIVSVANPNGRAEYTQTDTSAFEHIREYIADLYKEAASYGANFLSSGSKESGESLSIRKAGQGASLVTAVKNAGQAIESALKFIARMKGIDEDSVKFSPNIEFAEKDFSFQDLTALVTAWMSGAIDHDTLLDNIREGGYIKNDKTNEEIKNARAIEKPAIDPEAEAEEEDEEPTKEDVKKDGE